MSVDAALAVLTAMAVYQVRFRLFPGEPDPAAFQPAWAALTVYAGLWVTILYFRGEYRMRAHWTVRGEVSGIIRAIAWLAAVTIVVLFFIDLSTASRLFLLLLFPIQAAVTISTRIALRTGFGILRRNGRNVRYVVIVGTDTEATAFARLIAGNPYLGLRVVGFVGPQRPASTGCDTPPRRYRRLRVHPGRAGGG